MKSKKKIGIVGMGYVGQAMFRLFQNHYDVVPYDAHKSSFVNGSVVQLVAVDRTVLDGCDAVFVCVPTPIHPDTGGCDTRIVEEVVDWVQSPLVIIKSTVEPGTTDRLKNKTGKRLVFSPEYCGESSYWTPYAFHTDVKETPFFIFGGDKKDTTEAVSLFLPVVGPVKTYRQTTALEAELAKYIENSFYATKIAFCYEMANLVEKAGADWNEVRELWLLDPRLNPMHTAVFPENDKPFGGKCLPKDLRALANYAMSQGYNAELLWSVLRANDSIGQYRAEKRKA